MILLVLVFGVLIFFMFRRNRAQQKAQQAQQSKMVPGVEVMTSFGLYGRIASIDEEANKVVLEVSPGSFVTVHRQAVTKLITEDDASTLVPDDASSLTGDHTAGGVQDPGSKPETAEETLARLNKENGTKDQ
ncbi:preprotein translocase subunit YajC [Psychromicrobium xiongbiense]|uniref:preprotein translocase subunit YajC n=1 Tax=Psychromicrobium xiongbiense TaxID=3051184 RepID=UPI0025522F90|nr:preprotein translocase subunit YajC [Psychromicrobium sp. YIM S02556]